jgi:HD superfamily phosphohydrolase
VSDPHKVYEIRCPVHGFIPFSDWEREIINQPAFQRLRRIRQLAWTDQVYPGAMHTRFEHSLGVMHLASRLYDSIVQRSGDLLRSELTYTDAGLDRDRILVRLAALLHDVGHSPFSHGAEELFPFEPSQQKRYRHEQYSAAIIRTQLRGVIENHPLNQNCDIKADAIAALLEGSPEAGRTLFWRELIDEQMDADRMDYLLRDSLHCGVDYGKYDLRRLIVSIRAIPGGNERGLKLGVAEGGFHAAESLVLARYFMFTQVYFHKTRVAFDHHLLRALAEILPGGLFPAPTPDQLSEFQRWDDWTVLGALAAGGGGEHGKRLASRDHYREVFHTPEVPKASDLRTLNRIRDGLGNLLATEERADKSWYKVGQPDIRVVSDNPGAKVAPLSTYSSIVKRLQPIEKVMLFCRKEDVPVADERIQKIMERRK